MIADYSIRGALAGAPAHDRYTQDNVSYDYRRDAVRALLPKEVPSPDPDGLTDEVAGEITAQARRRGVSPELVATTRCSTAAAEAFVTLRRRTTRADRSTAAWARGSGPRCARLQGRPKRSGSRHRMASSAPEVSYDLPAGGRP